MKLTLFGATGKTGLELLEQALEKGYEVTAYVRTPSKLTQQNSRLTVKQGDLSETDKVREAVRGADAVLSALGPVNNKPQTPLTEGFHVITDAMQQEGVKQLILVTGAGVPDPNDEPKFINHAISTLLKLMAGNVLKDSKGVVEVVKNSALDWTIVRVPRLTDKAATGTVKTGYVGTGPGTQISRADVATFMLEQLKDDTWLRKAPAISN